MDVCDKERGPPVAVLSQATTSFPLVTPVLKSIVQEFLFLPVTFTKDTSLYECITVDQLQYFFYKKIWGEKHRGVFT